MDFVFNNENIVANYEKENIMLFNKDCLEVLEAMPNNSIDMVITDPPYRITRRGGGIKKKGKKYCGGIFDINNKDEETVKNIKSGKLFTHNNITFDEWLPLLYNVLNEGRTLLFDD